MPRNIVPISSHEKFPRSLASDKFCARRRPLYVRAAEWQAHSIVLHLRQILLRGFINYLTAVSIDDATYCPKT